MPPSYLQQSSPDPSFTEAWNIGAHLFAEEQSRQERRQVEAREAQQRQERQDAEFRQQMAVIALQHRERANEIKSQNTIDWRQGYWQNNVNQYLGNLQKREAELTKYTDPKLAWQWSKDTREAAHQGLTEIQQLRQNITAATPTDWNTFHDPADYMANPTVEFNPVESDEAVQAREEARRYRDAQIANLNARTNYSRTRTQSIGSGDKERAKVLAQAMKARTQFINATRGVYGTGPLQNTDGTMLREPQRDELGLPVDPNAQVPPPKAQAAKVAWAKSSGSFLEALQNPDIAGDDVATLVQSTAPQFSNLSTFDDFHDWLNYLSKQDYKSSPEGQQAGQTVLKLRSILLGENPNAQTIQQGYARSAAAAGGAR